MKRTHAALAAGLVTLTVAGLVGCSTGSDDAEGPKPAGGDSPKIAYVAKDMSYGWFQNEGEGVSAAADAAGYSAIVMDSRSDANTQQSNIDTALAQGVAGLILVTQDQNLGPAVAAQTAAANVPLVAVDDPIKRADDTPVPFVGMATEQIGEAVGDLLVGAAEERGWDLADVGVAGMTFDEVDVCKQRTDATLSAIQAGLPTISAERYVEANSVGNNTDGGLQAMQGLITAYPDVEYWLVYGCNEEGVVGAIRALEATGRGDTSCGVGLGDGALAVIEFEKGTPAYCGSVFADSKKHGETAVQLIVDFVENGVEIPEETLVPGVAVTVENWKEVFAS